MKMTDLFLAQLEREAPLIRRALEHVPEGRPDWKPHEKSMPLGRLAMLVAGMPAWLTMMIREDQLDLASTGRISALSLPHGHARKHVQGVLVPHDPPPRLGRQARIQRGTDQLVAE